MHFSHNDVLVIRVHIANCLVKRVLVDEGSLTVVLFLATLKRMKNDESLIQKSTTKLIAFNGTRSFVIGKIVMPVTLRKKKLYDDGGR